MSPDSVTAPVALIIFKRPELTAKVFEAIRQAQPSTLVVIADGPRTDKKGEAEACIAARAITENVDWPCRII
ncbi:MAG: glycosyltransferase family 2 protein, partial [Acidobacteriota bacterium]